MSNRPNLFIVGAPKCGTTAWYEYLRQHADISFSKAKEPHYFCEDFPNFRWAKSEDEYLKMFRDLEPTKYIGEASVMYLYSQMAAKNISEFDPNVKILVFLRNYKKFFASYHSQFYLMHDEDQNDLETVWNLQAERAEGKSIPPDCREPRFLQYREACSFGTQLKRLYQHFSRDQIKVIIFEEWTNDPKSMYQEIMEFLELENDGFTDFRKVNVKRSSRSRWLSRIVHRPPGFMLSAARVFRNMLGLKRLRLASKFKKLNEVAKTQHLPISDKLAQQIDLELKSDRELLESQLERRLPW